MRWYVDLNAKDLSISEARPAHYMDLASDTQSNAAQYCWQQHAQDDRHCYGDTDRMLPV